MTELSERMERHFEGCSVECEGSRDEEEALVSEVKALSTCDLCDATAKYRQCQKCMNDKLVGSHTDEEYETIKVELEQLKQDCKPFMAQIDQRKTYSVPGEEKA